MKKKPNENPSARLAPHFKIGAPCTAIRNNLFASAGRVRIAILSRAEKFPRTTSKTFSEAECRQQVPTSLDPPPHKVQFLDCTMREKRDH